MLKPALAAESCAPSERPRSTNIASTSKKTPPSNAAFRSFLWASRSRRHDCDSARLKEKYEVHHGVRIKDSAIVAAATLSHRYISDRFLPDKAIDLIDEAASSLRIQIDSMPTEIDQLERRATQLEIEKQALKKEEDANSKERLAHVEKELAGIREQSNALKAKWKQEKDVIAKARAERET